MSMLFKRFKDWAVSITSFRTGDVLPVDGPSGTAKMPYSDLAKEVIKDSANNPAATESDLVAGSTLPIMTANGPKSLPGNAIAKAREQAALTTYAQNVAHSIAPEFVPNETSAVAGMSYMYGGNLYVAKVNYTGYWDDSKFERKSVYAAIENLLDCNVVDLLADYPYTINTTSNGITYVGNHTTKTIHVSGTASDLSLLNIYYDTSNLPLYVKVGDILTIDAEGLSTDGVLIDVYFYPDTLPDRWIVCTGKSRFVIPSGCTGLLFRLRVANGTALPVGGVDVKFKFVRNISFRQLYSALQDLDSISARLLDLDNIVANNVLETLTDYPYTINTTSNGITYVGNPTTKTIHVSGTASDLSLLNIYYDQSAFPADINAGDVVSFEVDGAIKDKVFLRLFLYPNTLPNRNIPIVDDSYVVIPSLATGILLRIEVPNGVALPDGGVDVKFKMFKNVNSYCIVTAINYILDKLINPEIFGFEAFVQANAAKVGEMLLNNGTLFRSYNSQAGQTASQKLSESDVGTEILLGKVALAKSADASLLPILARHDNFISGGITFTWNDDKTIHVEGTVDGVVAAYNLIISRTQLIPGINPGDDVLVKIKNNPSGVKVNIFVYKNGSTSSSETIDVARTQLVKIPKDTTGLLVRLGVDADTTIASPGADVEVELIANPTIQHLKVLFIGNSYTNDCTAYTPMVMEGMCGDFAVTMGTSYYSGASINDYINFFDNDTATITYYKYSALSEYWDWESNKTIKEIVADEDWDIIVFQQASMSQGDWSTFASLNTLIDKILGYTATLHDKSVKVGWMMPQLRLSVIESVTYADVIDCVEKVLQTTPIDFFIPCGTAVETARTTSLNDIGASGGLTADSNGHLQAGLPSLLASYVTALKLFELCGKMYVGVLQEKTRPTSGWISAHHTPGENGTSTGVTDANCFLAQKCAVAAIKSPMEILSIAE